MIMLSEETAASVVNRLRSEFNMRIDDEQVPQWRETLEQAGLTDSNAKRQLEAFLGSRGPNDRRPTLRILANWLRGRTTDTPKRAYRPSGRECHYCHDTGYMDVPVPQEVGGGALKLLADFVPGVLWDRSPIYPLEFPCKCGFGKRTEEAEGLSEKCRKARDEAAEWYSRHPERSPSVLLYRYQRDCYEAYMARAAEQTVEEVVKERLAKLADVSDAEVPF
jgi:hypothetical protein